MKPSSIRLAAVLIFLMSGLGSQLTATVPAGWTSDYKAATASAKEKNRKMLLLFTGSDWCIWCKRLKQEILATEDFEQYARENIVLMFIDFPKEDYRTEAERNQNAQLGRKYNIAGYPTVVVADADGTELARLGYMQGGPKTFIRALERAGH